LSRHRELAIEAYKIFPNRVLCEATRRRRNDKTWAKQGAKIVNNSSDQPPLPSSSAEDASQSLPPVSPCKEEGVGKGDLAEDGSVKGDSVKGAVEVVEDLLQCWGIGAAKASIAAADPVITSGAVASGDDAGATGCNSALESVGDGAGAAAATAAAAGVVVAVGFGAELAAVLNEHEAPLEDSRKRSSQLSTSHDDIGGDDDDDDDTGGHIPIC
jgi:hypothetical protein